MTTAQPKTVKEAFDAYLDYMDEVAAGHIVAPATLMPDSARALILLHKYYGEKYDDTPIINEALICLAEEKKLMQFGTPMRDGNIIINQEGETEDA